MFTVCRAEALPHMLPAHSADVLLHMLTSCTAHALRHMLTNSCTAHGLPDMFIACRTKALPHMLPAHGADVLPHVLTVCRAEALPHMSAACRAHALPHLQLVHPGADGVGPWRFAIGAGPDGVLAELGAAGGPLRIPADVGRRIYRGVQRSEPAVVFAVADRRQHEDVACARGGHVGETHAFGSF